MVRSAAKAAWASPRRRIELALHRADRLRSEHAGQHAAVRPGHAAPGEVRGAGAQQYAADHDR
jgi:hypothetical protein